MLQQMAIQMDQQEREREAEIERVQQEEEQEKTRNLEEIKRGEAMEEMRNQARLKKDVHLHTLQAEGRPMGLLDGVVPAPASSLLTGALSVPVASRFRECV